MESVLYAEPIMRRLIPPLSIGHTDYLWYGEKTTEDEDDPLGTYAAYTRVGCPLESVDLGNTRDVVPLVKTFEYIPDYHRQSGNVYIETIHYFKDGKYLIPLRTKIHSGYSQGLKVAHLPSLNYIREDLSGMGISVTDPRSEIVSELLTKDTYFDKHRNRPIMDWIRDDLTNHLAATNLAEVIFDSTKFDCTIQKYRQAVLETPYDHSMHHLRNIIRTIQLDDQSCPAEYISPDVIAHPIMDVKNRLVPHPHNLASTGVLKVRDLPGIEYNTYGFQSILGVLDSLPLTDVNVDVIVDTDRSIKFVHIHVAVNRLAVFEDNDLGAFSAESLLSDILNEITLHNLLKMFVKHHQSIGNETREIIDTQPIKIKIIKTISDEALILLYRFNATEKDSPLCGVYFDIALQSLAPITIIPQFNGT